MEYESDDDNIPLALLQRKEDCNQIITSEESEEEDNVPLSHLKKIETDKIELPDDETETEYTDSEISILSDSEFEPEKCNVKHCISVADHECNMCNMALCTKHSKTKTNCQYKHRLQVEKSNKKRRYQEDLRVFDIQYHIYDEQLSFQNEYINAYTKMFAEESRVLDTSRSYHSYDELLEAENNYDNAYWSDAADLNTVEDSHHDFIQLLTADHEYINVYREMFPNERPKKRSRKQIAEPEKWGKNVKKMKRNKGEEYINAKGKVVPAKCIRKGCGQRCRFKCHANIDENMREMIFTGYWKMGDVNLQRGFITKTVTKIERHLKSGNSRRSNTFLYHFIIGHDVVKVCKTFYLDTLGIKQDIIYGAFNKLDMVGNIIESRQGRHTKKKVSLEARELIEKHIKLFPHTPSHYCRKTTSIQYLSPELSITKMHRLYVETCKEKDIVPENKDVYSETFHSLDVKLAFHKPKKDQCDDCVAFDNISNPTTEEITGHTHHLEMKDLARRKKNEIKNKACTEANVAAACFDLQQVLQVPHGEVSQYYYRRKLGVYNLSIYEYSTSNGFCYMWPEHVSGRGTNEVASSVINYIKQKVEEGKTIVFLMSDNCPGQNKNTIMATMMWHCMRTLPLERLEHGFLEKGHTQNENDSIHATITCKSKHQTIYTPEQWYQIARMSRIKPQPYKVKEMALTDFYDFKSLSTQLQNFEKDDNGDRINWLKVRSLAIERHDPNVLMIKYHHEGNAVRLNLMQRVRRRASVNDPGVLENLKSLRGITAVKNKTS